MTAEGKITTTAITQKAGTKTGVRILVTQDPDTGALDYTYRKTGAVAVTVIGFATVAGSRQCRYQLQTSAGTLTCAPSQTHWLARDKDPDAAILVDNVVEVVEWTGQGTPDATEAAPTDEALTVDEATKLTVVARHPQAADGSTRYDLSNGWFVMGETHHDRRHFRDHRYSAYAPGASPDGFATAVGTGGNLDQLVRSLAASIRPVTAPTEPSLPEGETFEQQASTDGGKTWRTVAVGLTRGDVDAWRVHNPQGEGTTCRFVPDGPADQAEPTPRPEPADGFGPVDAVYAPGDRISTVDRDGRASVGVVVEACDPVFKDGRTPQSWDTAYTVRTPVGGEIYVDTTRMRRELPIEIGQTWTSTRSDGIPSALTIERITDLFYSDDPNGLIVTGLAGEPHGIALSSYGWAQVTSGPHPHGGGVKRCDVGGEALTGPYWLLHGYGRGWEADRGAACAYHCGQPKPEAVPDAGPAPRDGYARAVEADDESAPFVSGWGTYNPDGPVGA
jgi:hypothetical protein